MLAFCAFSILFSLPFFFMGAWPVVGFFGLDALAVYLAFKLNYRAARIYETVDVTPLELVVAKVSARGRRLEWRCNPTWVRLEEQRHAEFGTERVALVSRGQRFEIGGFLGPEQKHALALDLARALALARRGAQFG
jgi:uncharacterized membrane protein